MLILFSVIKGYFLADFISGLGHWWEDRYATVRMKLIAKAIVLPNMLHHKMPKAFLNANYWQRNNIPILATTLIALIMYYLHILGLTGAITLLVLSQINEAHAYSHRSQKDIPQSIRFLQKAGLLQTAKHHNLHHSGRHEYHFCILTVYLNPVLDTLGFFRFLERIILFFNIKTNE